MAQLSLTALAAKIVSVITANGNKEITGAILNDLLQDFKDSGFNITTHTTANIKNAATIGGTTLTDALNNLLAEILKISSVAIVVPLGGGQSGATLLNAYDNVIDAVGTVGYGVKLTSSDIGYRIKVKNNDASKDLLVYPKSGGKFKDGDSIVYAIDDAFTIAPGNGFEFVIYETGEIRF